MSAATPSGEPGPPGPRKSPLFQRKALLAGAAILALLLLAVAVLAWSYWRKTAAADDQQRQLQSLLERGRTLSAELASIKPASAPACPPGFSLKTFAPGAQLPPATSASAGAASPSSGKGGPSSASAAVLPDHALAQRLEMVTAMVLVEDGGNLSGGTGFFISPNLLITNRHVVGGTGARLLLVSRSLKTPRRATLLTATPGHEFGAADFALVRLEDGSAPSFVEVTSDVGKLAPVIAAGYPAVVVKDDPNFRRLLGGDSSAAPDLNLTQGAVRSLQVGAGGLPVIVHTASIAKGNSGGPLVDACGRVVGINTYISVDKEQSEKVNYALRSEGMVGFLTSAGAVARSDTRTCGTPQ